MSIETPEDSIERTLDRMRQSRAEIITSLQTLHVHRTPPRDEEFPRSAIMRAALGHNGRMMLGGAALTLAMLRPGLIPIAVRVARLVPLLPLARNLLNRYLVRRNREPE
jgi:hypothetical protein